MIISAWLLADIAQVLTVYANTEEARLKQSNTHVDGEDYAGDILPIPTNDVDDDQDDESLNVILPGLDGRLYRQQDDGSLEAEKSPRSGGHDP